MAGVKLAGVRKSYGAADVLKDIDLEIMEGELMVFVGPSGCGKSTLLRMIAGLEKITGGALEIDGRPMNDVPPAERGVAMVFQSYALYPHMTVRENMGFALEVAHVPKAERRRKVEAAAEMLQLGDLLDRLPKALSGGQRQRVAIGRAIVRDPNIYLFDEPLSNLDASLRVATRIEIAKLKERMPEATMIYVTHDQVEAMTLATRIAVLADGGVAQVGSPLELYERPCNEFVAQFIGSPSMNLIPGEIVATGARTEVALAGGARAVAATPTEEGDRGRAVNLGVRPEDLSPAPEGSDALFRGEVAHSEALGEVTLLYFTAAEGCAPVIAKLIGVHRDMRGREMALSAPPEKLHLFAEGLSLASR